MMMLFEKTDCFEDAVNTAALINSVCRFVINRHFANGEVTFGIGIDYGKFR
jgi:adenylate cyclase